MWHESNGAVAKDGDLVQVRRYETLVFLITNTGEFLLYFTVIFFSFIKKKKKKKVVVGLFLGCPAFAAGIHFQWIKNSKGKKFSTGYVGKLIVIKWNT